MKDLNDYVCKADEFYEDARKDLHYDNYLTEEGCKHLENYAYGRGHREGYDGIFNQLSDLTLLIKKLRPHIYD